LHRRGVTGVRRDDDRVVQRAVLAKRLDDAGDLPRALADRAVDADDVLALLVDDRVDRDRRLPGTTVADDELTLAAADRDHRVDRLDPGLQRLLHRLTEDDAGSDDVDEAAALSRDVALAIDRLAERVDHAADVARADGNVEHAAGPAHGVALLDLGPVAHDD